jgi:ATP-dependent DNA ligase
MPRAMLRSQPAIAGFIQPCLPSPAERPPTGADWVHEIKHDGYRLMVRPTARACSSSPATAERFPLIVAAAPTR